MDQRTLLLLLAVIFVNVLSRFYGFRVIAGLSTQPKKGLFFWPAVSVQLLVPLFLPKEHPILRWFMLSNTCLHVFKLIDYYNRYESLSEKDKNFKRFFQSFECLYTADIRKSFIKTSPPEVGRLVHNQAFIKGFLYVAFGMTFLLLNRRFGWWSALGGSFLLEYSTLAVEYYFLCVGLVNLGVGIHRMMGYEVEGFFHGHARACSPGEFWVRWNVPVHEWLRDNVYRKFGGDGHRYPYCGLFATFLVSGLFHEYTVSLATNTFNGFMLAYFMTQFLSVVLSISLHRLLSRGLPDYANMRSKRWFLGVKWFLTLSCVLLPVPLFIHNFKKIFPLHTF